MPLVESKCSGLIFLGVDNEKLHAAFNHLSIPQTEVRSMKEAVTTAYRMAEKGETVLLSPACASFDLFTSYEDRGDQFKKEVLGL